MRPLRTEASHLRQTCREPRIVRSTPQSQTRPKRRRVRSGYLYYRLDPRASPEYPGAFLDGLLHLRSIPHPLALPFTLVCIIIIQERMNSRVMPSHASTNSGLASVVASFAAPLCAPSPMQASMSGLKSVENPRGALVRDRRTDKIAVEIDGGLFNAGFGFSMSRRTKSAAMRPPIRRSPAARLPTIQSR